MLQPKEVDLDTGELVSLRTLGRHPTTIRKLAIACANEKQAVLMKISKEHNRACQRDGPEKLEAPVKKKEYTRHTCPAEEIFDAKANYGVEQV